MSALDELRGLLGAAGFLDDRERMAPYLDEWRGRYHGRAAAVLRPAATAEVAAIVECCARAAIGVVPQGGNTGLCGGAVATDSRSQVIVSLERMNRIREINADAEFVVAEAGCILAELQQAAADADRLFPLSLSAESRCQIGGNLATDAGGLNVLRYGTARQQVLGLEVVLADGRVWNGLRTLRKNTAGYDLRNLFVGAEGTLGIITAAALRLWPRPRDVATGLLALPDTATALPLLAFMRARLGEEISAFELISRRAMEFVTRHTPGTRYPFARSWPAYVLVETTTHDADRAYARLQQALEAALDAGYIEDAVLAEDARRREALWQLRHGVSDAQRHEGVSIKHDVSLPLHRVGAFLARAEPAVLEVVPEARVVVFGHLGDGNLHYNISQPAGGDADTFREREPALNEVVFGLVQDLGGSFSAEHGVGLLRRKQLQRYLDPVEVDLMRRMKSALDPAGIMNPGKVL